MDLFAHVLALISRLVQHPRNSRHKNLNSESVGISAQIKIYPIKPFALFEWKQLIIMANVEEIRKYSSPNTI